ncbi:sensor histidine kinase [Egicoccus halophilus]|uniref:Sensor-like histidine kinase SenX3 n=1 Tax=Egicoccus halophilus TaxID=1670830 RepID=A0A8J3AHR6_9ACTN|nr:ATP-binding protein [Egicoccus halophilus]GGI08949.1 PAS domain-containing sensor histidine kinase [Egicoccus halophilus]
MNPRPLLLALGLGLAAFALARAAPAGLGLALVLALAILVGVGADAAENRRLARLAERVNAWVGAPDHRTLVLRGGAGWRQLGIALNALGAAYARRGERIARERPWRRELVDSLVQPSLLFSAEGRLLAANDAARDLLGIPVDAGDITVVQAVGSAALAGAVREARESRTPVVVDAEHGEHELRSAVSLVGDETLVLITDRTRERRVEELRRNFVVNASHELKTPVTGIQSLAEALQVTIKRDPDRVPSLVNQLNGEAERLTRLVHDLLDLRRLEERGPLERVPVDLAELVRQVVVGQLARAEQREVEIGVDAPDRAFVAGVPGDLEVIVKNLVGNAVQYNRPGGSVDVSLVPEGGTYVLLVRDTGIGIPQQDLSRVFERFYRVDTARSRETGGTGLGLAIVRHAVERHGGSVRVESLLGEGTTFTVTIPVEPRG